MAKIKDSLGNIAGKVNGWIFCTRNGTNYFRKSAEKVKTQPTEKQKMLRHQLKSTSRLYSAIKETSIVKPWAVAGKKINKNCYNYFVSENCKIFDANGKFNDYGQIKLSVGDLHLPPKLECKAEGTNTIRVEWENDRKNYTGSGGDRLHVFMMYDDHTFRYVYRDDLNSYRKDGCALIDLTEEEGHPEHIYCFFSSRDFDKFSNSLYKRIKWNE